MNPQETEPLLKTVGLDRDIDLFPGNDQYLSASGDKHFFSIV